MINVGRALQRLRGGGEGREGRSERNFSSSNFLMSNGLKGGWQPY